MNYFKARKAFFKYDCNLRTICDWDLECADYIYKLPKKIISIWMKEYLIIKQKEIITSNEQIKIFGKICDVIRMRKNAKDIDLIFDLINKVDLSEEMKLVICHNLITDEQDLKRRLGLIFIFYDLGEITKANELVSVARDLLSASFENFKQNFNDGFVSNEDLKSKLIESLNVNKENIENISKLSAYSNTVFYNRNEVLLLMNEIKNLKFNFFIPFNKTEEINNHKYIPIFTRETEGYRYFGWGKEKWLWKSKYDTLEKIIEYKNKEGLLEYGLLLDSKVIINNTEC